MKIDVLKIIAGLLLFKTVESLRAVSPTEISLLQKLRRNNEQQNALRRIVESGVKDAQSLHKRENKNGAMKIQKLRQLYNALKNMPADEKTKLMGLRQKSESAGGTIDKEHQIELKGDFGKQVEEELKLIAMNRGSDFTKKPYIEHRGKNDFLVMSAQNSDPFLSHIPNDIYYPRESKCVNWLDECNVRGLRAQLLQKVYSPFK